MLSKRYCESKAELADSLRIWISTEVEQSAFSPSHLIPGIEPSNDKMLQGRLFSYPDTHRHRLGKNYEQIPINCPYRARVAHYSRDGAATVNGNFGSAPNYEP